MMENKVTKNEKDALQIEIRQKQTKKFYKKLIKNKIL